MELARRVIQAPFPDPSMEPEFALRMERLPRHEGQTAPAPSMEPEFALRMELLQQQASTTRKLPFNGAGVCTPDGTYALEPVIRGKVPSMEPEFALRMEPDSRVNLDNFVNPSMEPEFALRMEPWLDEILPWRDCLQWSRSLHSGWNCSLKIAKENKPCKRLFRAPERRGRIFLSIQHGGRKNSFILADCHCENPPL